MTDGILLFWLGCGLAGAVIGDRKGHGVIGFILGCILGPIGLLIVLSLDKPRQVTCVFCKEQLHQDAVVCPHCQREMPGRPMVSGTAAALKPPPSRGV